MTFPGLGGKKRNLGKKAKINNHEKQIAKKLGGRRQLGSGCTAKEKGDIKLDKFLLDSKETINTSIKVDSKDLAKISLEARQVGKYPGLVLTLETGLTVDKEWCMIPLDVFTMFLNKIKDAENDKYRRAIEASPEETGDSEGS